MGERIRCGYTQQPNAHTNTQKQNRIEKERATNFVVGTNELNFLVFLESRGFVALKLLLIERWQC